MQLSINYYASEALSDDVVWSTSVWRLSRTSGLNREQRGLGRLIKIGTEVAYTSHVTRTPLSRSKCQRSTCCWCLK